jgi:hypothetical protein
MNKKVLAIVTLLTIILSLISASSVQAAYGMSPTQGVVGLEVTLSGLTDGIAYNIKWDDNSIKQGTAGSTGNVSFFVPESYGGEHKVKLEQPSGSQVFSGTYTVLPYIAIDPNLGSTGTTINVAGRGFGVSEKNVAVTYDGVNVQSGITADANGSWSTSFKAPPSAKGNHAVDASGDITKGTDVADKTFAVSPIVKMDPLAGGVGTLVTITATGFSSAEGGVKVLYSGKEVRSGITAEVSGAWSTSFAVPSSTRGSHIVNVQGNTTASKDIPDMIFTVAPAVTVSPNSGSVEDAIKISGNGFANNENSIEVTFDGKTLERSIVADDSGFWTVSSKVPSSSSGAHTLGASGRITPATDVATTTFTIQSVLTVVPKGGNVGDELRVSGSGFNAGKDFSVTWDNKPVASGTVNESGAFQTIFKAPGGKSGPIAVAATDTRSASASTTFNMETTPPEVPQISSPKDGATVGFMGDTKVSFKWSDVSDPSGVTYDLEIADQSNFVKKLVSRSKLTESKYVLPEAEALQNGEYYWHVRAVDGANNASDWSQTAMVRVGFVTTTTLIYIGVGIVALLILVVVLNRTRRKKKTRRDWE